MQAIVISASTLNVLNSVISTIGTVATVTIAARALSSWKRQLRATDRRALSHSIFDELTEFIRLNRQFRFKCENWHYTEQLEAERVELENEVSDAMCKLERSFVKLYLLSDINENELTTLQSELHKLMSMARCIRYAIQTYHYEPESVKVGDSKLQSMLGHMPQHAEALKEFQVSCMSLLRKSLA